MIEDIKGVKKVTFSSKDNELNSMIDSQNDEGKQLFETFRDNNPLGAAYIIEVSDAKDIQKIADEISQLEHVNEVSS